MSAVELSVRVPDTEDTAHLHNITSTPDGEGAPLAYLIVLTCAHCGGRLEHKAGSAPRAWKQVASSECTVCHAEYVLAVDLAQTKQGRIVDPIAQRLSIEHAHAVVRTRKALAHRLAKVAS
jgi:hypothetical protein